MGRRMVVYDFEYCTDPIWHLANSGCISLSFNMWLDVRNTVFVEPRFFGKAEDLCALVVRMKSFS